MSDIGSLLKDKKDKSLKIVELENIIRKQNIELQRKDDEIKSLQILLKQRTHKINKMNTQFFRMEEQLMGLRKFQEEVVLQSEKIAELEEIIRFQTEEMQNYLQDQQNYVNFMQEFYASNQNWYDQRALLYEYRDQLQKQIEQVQNINEKLIISNDNYESELYQQNQQGNDLLGQIQYIVECCQGVQ